MEEVYEQIDTLSKVCEEKFDSKISIELLKTGSKLIKIPNIPIKGYNRDKIDILFIIPSFYPCGQPDCFWIEGPPLRLSNGSIPRGTSDSNPIQWDYNSSRQTTWFICHAQSWNPNRDTLTTYFRVIMSRFERAF